jgi:ABC-type transport system involved in multi-copper enzyme maturation permease subunit
MRLLAITRLTVTELRSGRLIILPLTVAVALVLVAANIENPNAWGNDLLVGMWSGLAVVGSLVAILTASGTISADIERGTMLLLAARPVSRTSIVLGKALGVAAYLACCVLLWAVALALGIGSQVDAGAWVAFWGTLLVMAPMLLAAGVAMTASALFPTRGAIGGTLALWFAAAIVASIPLTSVKAANVDRVELVQGIMGWVLPAGRLDELPSLALGASMPAGTWLALVVGAAWFALAGLLFRMRGSLAR